MRIFVTGATGFIGGHVLRALAARGHTLTCLVRPGAGRRLAAPAGACIIEGLWTTPESWLRQLDSHEAVVNTVGIIRERRGASFEAVHATAPIALFEAAAEAGVRKIVQLSAMGADEQATTRYHQSKRAADLQLARLAVPSVVLRPSLVYGPGDHSMTRFARLARLPLTPVPGDGAYLLQPVHVDDVVQAIVLAVERSDLAGLAVDLGGAEILSFNALLDRLARLQGRPGGARTIHIPWPLMRLVARVTDLLCGHGPITSEELSMLRQGNYGDNGPCMRAFGFEPRPFSWSASWLRRSPSDHTSDR